MFSKMYLKQKKTNLYYTVYYFVSYIKYDNNFQRQSAIII